MCVYVNEHVTVYEFECMCEHVSVILIMGIHSCFSNVQANDPQTKSEDG